MLKKSFAGRLRRGFCVATATSMLSLGALSCQSPTDSELPPQTHRQQCSLDVSPTSGISPLEVEILGECTDQDGQDDIVRYEVLKDGEVLSTINPTNIVMNLTEGNYTFSLESEDRQGNIVSEGPISVNVSSPPTRILSQTAELINYVDIAWTGTLENISAAELEVKHEGDLMLTETITSPYSEKTFEERTKGNWEFIFSAEGVASDIKEVEVPNYNPTADQDFLNSLETDFNEGSEIILNFQGAFSDKNSEDIVPIHNVRPLDEKTEVSFIDYDVKIKGLGEFTGNYAVEIEFGTPEGGLEKTVIEGEIFDLARFQGKVQNLRTKSLDLNTALGEKVSMYIYTAPDSTFLISPSVDENGNYDFKLDKPLEDDILFQIYITKLVPAGPVSGHVRTITLPAKDTTGILKRTYPHNEVLSDAGINKEGIRKHMEELDSRFIKAKVDSVEITYEDPLDRGSFTLDYQLLVKDKIQDPEDIGCYFPGQQLYIQIDDSNTPDSMKHYRVGIPEDGTTVEVIPDPGWVVVTRDTTEAGGETKGYGEGKSYTIELKPATEGLIAHEFGHVALGPRHSTTLDHIEQTIMNAGAPARTTPGPADCEASYIKGEIYHEVINPGGTFMEGESYDNTMGLDIIPISSSMTSDVNSSYQKTDVNFFNFNLFDDRQRINHQKAKKQKVKNNKK